MNAALREPCLKLRGPIVRRAAGRGQVVRDGGVYGAGLIRDVAIITRGEALGHSTWVDGHLLYQVVTQLNAQPGGLKSRFAHPSVSADGIGKALGRCRNARADGDSVRADMHLFKTAHSTPDGNLAEYVLNLAEEDAAALGLSIVFAPDSDMEKAFTRAHTDRKGKFISPDADNTENLPHA